MSDLTLRMGAGGEPVGGSFWQAVGGRETFEKLVRAFYAGVADDPVLLPMYPEQPDLEGAIQRLTGFLEQYWGGPGTYSEQRGHPRLRMRHVPFAVGPVQIETWLRHMLASLDELALPPDLDAPLRQYLITAAYSLQNTDELPDTGTQGS